MSKQITEEQTFLDILEICLSDPIYKDMNKEEKENIKGIFELGLSGTCINNNHNEFIKNKKINYQKKVRPLEERIKMKINGYVKNKDLYIKDKIGSPSETYPDPVIKETTEALLNSSTDDVKKILDAHKICMTIENKIGILLEEYIYINIKKYGFIRCCGDILHATDIIHCERKILLQIKNSDNSENSSSKPIRKGTKIIKWHRRVSKKNPETEDAFKWDELNNFLKLEPNTLTEESFLKYVNEVFKNHPKCIDISAYEDSWKTNK